MTDPATPPATADRTATPLFLFGGAPRQRERWRGPLETAFAACDPAPRLCMDPAGIPPAEVDYVLCQENGTITDLAPFAGATAIFSMWAGVEWITHLRPPPRVPVLRMVEAGMTQGMTDYVAGHVLRYHLDLDGMIAGVHAGAWGQATRGLATDRRVGIAGLGTLGRAVARVLGAAGFALSGWSRRRKSVPGVVSHAGAEEFGAFLAELDILVLLLPLTPATEGLFDRAAFDRLPAGARIINAGRGGLVDDAALLASLDRGHIAHATLDVFRTEPLPADHPFRRHPRVTVTPHIASVTRPATAARAITDQIRRRQAGLPFENVYDPRQGY